MGMRAHVTSTRSRAERPQRVCIYTYAVTYTCPVAELYRTGSSASVRSIPAGRARCVNIVQWICFRP